MKTILICGFGYVGQAVYRFFKGKYEVKFYDPAVTQRVLKNPVEREAYTKLGWTDTHCKADLTVICVPTQPKEDGSCDTSIVEEAIGKLPKENKLVLIKSTVAPGTTDRLKDKLKKRIVFSPEYISEGNYDSTYDFHTSMAKCPFIILGGDPEDTTEILDIMAPIVGPQKKFRQTTAKTAEVVKYWENFYFACKIVFSVSMANACDAFGVNYYEARDLWALDPRVDIMHTLRFKNNGGAYGGKCLPKDTLAFCRALEEIGKPDEFLNAIVNVNAKRAKKWEGKNEKN